MGSLKQHSVYWVNLDPTQGGEISKIRPCVVVSPVEINKQLNTVVIVPLTSTLRSYPFRVRCFVSGKVGELAVDQIRTIDKTRLNVSKPLGHLSVDEIYKLQNTINEMFCR
jgi:mRNA interferase MazF